MSTTATPTARPTALTVCERVAKQLVTGASTIEAASLGLKRGTVRHSCTGSRKRQVASADAVLATKQVASPPAPSGAPVFTDEELCLLRALAEHSGSHHIFRRTPRRGLVKPKRFRHRAASAAGP